MVHQFCQQRPDPGCGEKQTEVIVANQAGRAVIAVFMWLLMACSVHRWELSPGFQALLVKPGFDFSKAVLSGRVTTSHGISQGYRDVPGEKLRGRLRLHQVVYLFSQTASA